MSVRDIDLGWSKLFREMKELDKKAVKVGIQAGETTEDGENDLAYIGGVHEFGSEDGTIPQRSFIRAGVDNKMGEIKNLSQVVSGKIIDGMSVNTGLNLIGLGVTGIIQEYISSGNFTPLKPNTIARKGSSKPLIDTGHLRQSIRHVLED